MHGHLEPEDTPGGGLTMVISLLANPPSQQTAENAGEAR